MHARVSLWMSFEGPASSIGRSISRSVGGCGLNGLVGHDAGGELLLSLLETSAGGTVERVHLERNGREKEAESSLKHFSIEAAQHCMTQFADISLPV